MCAKNASSELSVTRDCYRPETDLSENSTVIWQEEKRRPGNVMQGQVGFDPSRYYFLGSFFIKSSIFERNTQLKP